MTHVSPVLRGGVRALGDLTRRALLDLLAGATDVATGRRRQLVELTAETGGCPVPGDGDAFSARVGPGYGRG